MRTNVYKEKILDLLSKRHLMTVAEIGDAIPGADSSTIFRNVKQLLEEGSIKQVLIDGKSTSYECTKDAHDHFICNTCSTVSKIHLNKKELKGLSVSDITVRGICNACKE